MLRTALNIDRNVELLQLFQCDSYHIISMQCTNDTSFYLNTKLIVGWTISIFRERDGMPLCQHHIERLTVRIRQAIVLRIDTRSFESSLSIAVAREKKGKKKCRRFEPMAKLRIVVEFAVYAVVYVDGEERLLWDNTLSFES